MSPIFPRWAVGFLWLLSCLSLVTSQTKYLIDAQVSFYVDITMTCDHPALNITEMTDIRSLSWILPDGRTVDSESYLNPRFFSLAGPPTEMQVAGDRSSYDEYSLTAFEIDADVFGYYSCVVVYTSPTKPISVIRWGLNVDGANFDDLMETYKDGAIVGGVAAAVFFVIVVGTCLVWHYCFNDNSGVIEEGDIEVKRGNDLVKEKEHVYKNSAYNGDVDTTEVDISVDNGAGHNGLNTKM